MSAVVSHESMGDSDHERQVDKTSRGFISLHVLARTSILSGLFIGPEKLEPTQASN